MRLVDIERRLTLHHGGADFGLVAIGFHQRLTRRDRVLLGNSRAHAERNRSNDKHGADHVILFPSRRRGNLDRRPSGISQHILAYPGYGQITARRNHETVSPLARIIGCRRARVGTKRRGNGQAMKTVYRYSKERHFAQPPEAIWPFVADTARLNEMSGSPRYQVEERPDAQGRIHRFATVAVGPLRMKWEEGYGEWQENRRLSQTRNFINGPFRRSHSSFELVPKGAGTRLTFAAEVDCVGVLGWLAKASGKIGREGDKRLAAIEKLIAEGALAHQILGASPDEAVKPPARRRFDGLIADLDRDPASHGLA